MVKISGTGVVAAPPEEPEDVLEEVCGMLQCIGHHAFNKEKLRTETRSKRLLVLTRILCSQGWSGKRINAAWPYALTGGGLDQRLGECPRIACANGGRFKVNFNPFKWIMFELISAHTCANQLYWRALATGLVRIMKNPMFRGLSPISIRSTGQLCWNGTLISLDQLNF